MWYSCGPTAIRNAWIWQQQVEDDPLKPCPYTDKQLVERCKCTDTDGTQDTDLDISCLGADVTFTKDMVDVMWHTLMDGGGVIARMSVPFTNPTEARDNFVFMYFDEDQGCMRILNTIDRKGRHVHAQAFWARWSHFTNTWFYGANRQLPGWKPPVFWLVPRGNMEKYVPPIYRRNTYHRYIGLYSNGGQTKRPCCESSQCDLFS